MYFKLPSWAIVLIGIILGTRGLNSFQKMVLGSVSHKVAKRSQIPVIIVK